MNFQNIPRDDKTVKRAIIPKQDALFFFDYKSIEPRLTAFYLKKVGFPEMAQMFIDGVDPYIETAKQVFKGQEITDELRQVCKIVFLSQTYGGGLPTLLAQLGRPKQETMGILRAFHDAWPGLGRETRWQPAEPWTLLGRLQQELNRKGYIQTLWGRRYKPDEPHKRLNVLIQGCAADLMRSSLVKTHRFLRGNETKSHLVLTIHDELVVDCTQDEIPLIVEWVPEMMRYYPIHEHVPMEVDVEYTTTSWAEKAYYRESTQDLEQSRPDDTAVAV